jgi:micrococcal nuclease
MPMKPDYVYKAKVTHLVDGDTFDAIVDLGMNVHIKARIRVLGINTPEIRGENKEEGFRSKFFVANMLERTDNEVILQSHSQDSFHRWLCDVYIGDDNLAEKLLSEELAVPYVK